MTTVRQRILGIGLVVVGLGGLIGTGWAFSGGNGPIPGLGMWGEQSPNRSSTCAAPALPGQTVAVTLADMGGGMMGQRRMMRVVATPLRVAPGDLSFRVWNAGATLHELVVLPLPSTGAGSRTNGPDGRVDETGSLGEASASCAEGGGDGIAPGAVGWVTLKLAAGRYELICNLPGHYARGMFTELDVGLQS